ncbi:MAG: AI-2E family transporter [Sphingomonas sp. 28-62-20]|uniref:AI-2E family transporter n=1 Tax=Sphingomonas sp. 28-62-20 TaxID=1970433 RepID=UPI000BDB57C7|nr:MAG: AI-2E family transporter [Sphingomonas sp. 28-62-20]
MSKPPVDIVAGPAPNEFSDPFVRKELKRAAVWLGLAAAIALMVLLIQPLLIIFGGLVFASMLDGGVRLLGRALPIGRGWRLAIVMLFSIAFLVGTIYLTGVQVADQFAQLRATLDVQAQRAIAWAVEHGMVPGRADVNGLIQQALGSFGRLTSWIGTAVGAVTSMVMVAVIGLFVAIEPRLYERGLQWMVPQDLRSEFAITIGRMAYTMRRLLAGRLLGMAFEGVLIWFALMLGGVPMALVLGIIAGILAFIPNVGAILTGILMVAVGFSAGTHEGVWAIATYLIVQNFDGYVVIPLVAKHTVDMPPALTLSSQILASTLFGVIGLALADPIVAMIKVALERGSELPALGDGPTGVAVSSGAGPGVPGPA